MVHKYLKFKSFPAIINKNNNNNNNKKNKKIHQQLDQRNNLRRPKKIIINIEWESNSARELEIIWTSIFNRYFIQ